jgi:parvulin-like peptidyl-prolyl isomerase
MESTQLLTIDDQPISFNQALQYLKFSGKIQSFIDEIVRQYLIGKELETRNDLDVSPAILEQAVVNFRLDNQLTAHKRFQEWLSQNGMDYDTFHNQLSNAFKLEKLKAQITEPKLQEYFIERKIFLDKVVLSRIMVNNKELAEELSTQILEEGVRFEQLAREYSLSDDRIFNGMMGAVSRGAMPDALRAAVDSVTPGELLGPLEMEGYWGLFRVEQFLPASVEDSKLKQVLQNELFEQWLVKKIQKMTVNLQVDA